MESVKMGMEIGIVLGGWDDTTGRGEMVIGTEVVVFCEGGGEGAESLTGGVTSRPVRTCSCSSVRIGSTSSLRTGGSSSMQISDSVSESEFSSSL